MPVHATQDFTRQFSPSPSWKVLRKYGPWSIPEAPNTVIVNQIVDLGEWCLVNDQWAIQPDVVFTKPDGQGGWVPTVSDIHRPTPIPSDWPSPDPSTFGLIVLLNPLTDAGPGWPAIPGTPEFIDDNYITSGVWGFETGGRHPTNKCRFARLFIARGPTVYTPEEWAIVSQRRVHVNLTGPDMLVKEWVFTIPATNGVRITDFSFDLRDLGLAPGWEEVVMLAEVRRNGVPIRGDTGGDTSAPLYVGEVFDPPTYPVMVMAHGTLPETEYEYEPNNGFGHFARTRFGGVDRSVAFGDVIDDDINIVAPFNYCSEPLRSLVRVRVWRGPDEGRTEYRTARDQPLIPVPPGVKDNCTLHLKIYRSGRQRRGLHPFEPRDNTPDTWQMKDDIDAHTTALGSIAPWVAATSAKTLVEWVAVPATSTSPGSPGQAAYDAAFLYVCVAQDTWARTPVAAW